MGEEKIFFFKQEEEKRLQEILLREMGEVERYGSLLRLAIDDNLAHPSQSYDLPPLFPTKAASSKDSDNRQSPLFIQKTLNKEEVKKYKFYVDDYDSCSNN